MNAFPNEENYLLPSFNPAVEPPSVDPNEGVLISVAYNPAWTSVLMAACSQLQQYAAWDTDHDGKVLAVQRALMLMELLSADVSTVPAPFWDEESGDDADDTAPAADQPWYGQIVIIDDRLTFTENAFIWVVAGFIAYAGLPSAAISFVPLARTFVVTAKTNPLGGLIRFYADAQEIGSVDTYSAADGTVDVSLVMPPPTTGFIAETVTTYPTLWCVLQEDNPHDLPSVSMSIIRSRLKESDVTGDPTRIRYNSGTGKIQTSPDGGVTWLDDAAADPRYGSSFTRPPLGGDAARCDMAANRIKWFRDFITNTSDALCTLAEAFTVAGVILNAWSLLFPEAGVLFDAFIDTAGTIVGIGCAAFSTAFDDAEYSALECLFFCDSLDDGSYNQARFDQLTSDVAASSDFNETAKLIIAAVFFLQGWNGVNNAGTFGGQTGSCDECGCTWLYEWDFTVSDGGWSFATGTNYAGTWVSGQGWQATNNGQSNAYGFIYNCDMWSPSFDLASDTQILHFEAQFSAAGDSPGGHLEMWIGASRSEGLTAPPYFYGAEWEIGQGVDGTISGARSGQHFAIAPDWLGATPYTKKARIRGQGTKPDFTGGTWLLG